MKRFNFVVVFYSILFLASSFWVGCNEDHSITEPNKNQTIGKSIVPSSDETFVNTFISPLESYLIKQSKILNKELSNNEKTNYSRIFQAFSKVNQNNILKFKSAKSKGEFLSYDPERFQLMKYDANSDLTEEEIVQIENFILNLPPLMIKDVSTSYLPYYGDSKSGALSAHKAVVDASSELILGTLAINTVYFYASHRQTGIVPDVSANAWQEWSECHKDGEYVSPNGSQIVSHAATFLFTWHYNTPWGQMTGGSDEFSISAFMNLSNLE